MEPHPDQAERTWGIQKGKPSVAVAVLDSGVAYEDYVDPRRASRSARRPTGATHEFLPGYDFVNGDTHPNDDEYHGTHVASTIAEATNNATGVAGLAFGCAIMPVKVLDENGDGHLLRRGRGHRLRGGLQGGRGEARQGHQPEPGAARARARP